MDGEQPTDGQTNDQPAASSVEGQHAEATPNPSTDTAPQAGQEPGGKSQNGEGVERAQTLSRDEVDRKALAALDEGKSVDEARKLSREPEPTEDDAAGKGESTSGGNAGSQPAGEARRDNAGNSFEGLDAKSRQTLSQAHLLPDAESWESMPEKYRQNLLESAREILAGRSRNYQREAARTAPRDGSGRFAPGSQPTDGQAPGDDEQDRGGAAAGTTTDDQGQKPQDAQGTRAQSQRQQPPAKGKSKAFERIDRFAEELGDDIAAPLREGLQELDTEHKAQMTALEQRLNQLQEGNQYAMRQLVSREESEAKEQLTKDLGGGLTDQQWSEITTNAKVFAQAAYNARTQFTWKDCIVKAGRAVLTPNFQQQAQKKLAATRQKSLAGTPERGGAETKPNRGTSAEDRDRIALEALDSGKSVDEILSQFR